MPAPAPTNNVVSSDPVSSLQNYPVYTPTTREGQAQQRLIKDLVMSRNVMQRQYNYFNGRQLFEVIDDWTTRWNGYLVPLGVLDETNSNIFLNFTRNLITSYLSKAATQMVQPKIVAVNKRTNLADTEFAKVLKDLNQYTLNCENGPAKFLRTALEATVKGTAIVYEGYQKTTQKLKTPVEYDTQTGDIEYEVVDRVIFDNCYQELVKLEDFYISNSFEPDLQKQPFVLWRKVTSYQEAAYQFGHYKNWKYVIPGNYRVLMDPNTFYNEELYSDMLQGYQVEIYRYYNRRENLHIILCNGVVLYNGPIPFKHGKYPFAKYLYEPFGNDFFWGIGAPGKFMGEQDTGNQLVNMMVDKTYGSLLPFGLSSDLDDLIEDDTLAVNKIRKVGDINKWKFDTLPGVSSGEQAMLQTMLQLLRENSGLGEAGSSFSPKGGRLSVRQVLLQHQENLQRIRFSMNYLEDGERDRTELRLYNILQFYSIPKIQKITGKSGKEVEQLVYRDAQLYDTELSDGRRGTKVIKITDQTETEDQRQSVADELSVIEEMGEMKGTPTEALALPISMFTQFNIQVEVVKNSSYERNQALDQAMRQEYAQWRLSVAPLAPVNAAELVRWVDEAYDVDSERFEPEGQPMMGGPIGGQPPTIPGQAAPVPGQQVAAQMPGQPAMQEMMF